MSDADPPDQRILKLWRISERLSFPLDETRVAVWERYAPHVEDASDLRYYREYLDRSTSDTLGKRLRFLSVCGLVRDALARGVPGQFAECGVFTGHSAFLIASILRERGYGGELLLFDSFQGLSKPVAQDFAVADGYADVVGVQDDLRAGRRFFSAPQQYVEKCLGEFDFIEYFPGWIPECFRGAEEERFAFAHIDVDLYEPVRDSLEFFWPRLSPGGVIQVDDYNLADWPGATRAVDEFRARHQPALFFPIPLGGAFLVR